MKRMKHKSTITKEQERRIKKTLSSMTLPVGLGTKENACSIAAINLALTGKLTDDIPNCMSFVLGKWIISIQDKMPSSMRNSIEWKALLPLAAGTGRNNEKYIYKIILNWMWEDVLPYIQSLVDKHDFGEEWKLMCISKTKESAANAAAAYAAYAATYAAARAAAYAAYAADATNTAADATYAAANAAAYATNAAAYAATHAAAWNNFNPPALLKKILSSIK